MLKKATLGSFVIILLLCFTNQLVEGDRLLQRNKNYFELEAVDSTDTTVDTTVNKFFPVGPWYSFSGYKYDSTTHTDGVLNSIESNYSCMNIFVPTCEKSKQEYIDELKYGIETCSLHAFSSFHNAVGLSVNCGGKLSQFCGLKLSHFT